VLIRQELFALCSSLLSKGLIQFNYLTLFCFYL